MEEAMQPLEADQQIRFNKLLVLGAAASVILHLACTIALFILPQGSPATTSSVTYIDLGAPLQPAPAVVPSAVVPPMVVPPKEATPQEVAQEPETTQVPEPLPQVQQTKAMPDQAAAPQETRTEEQRPHTTIGLGLTKGYFKGLGDGETLREGIKGYYLEMLQGINEKWWLDQQLDKKRIAPVVATITVARNGDIVGSRILKGSGNLRYDKAVLAALVAASPLPPLPASYVGDFFEAPIRLVPPLNLMAW
ncbi:MAG TPA: TonB family protein [Geomonas sp.]